MNHGVSGVYAVYFSGFDEDIGTDFHGAQCSCGVGGEIGIACTAAQDHHAPLFEVADGAPADIRLGNCMHLDRRLYPGHQAHAFHRVHQSQRIDHGGKHAHIICGCAIHPAVQSTASTPQVAGPDHNRHIDSHLMDFFHAFGDVFCLQWVDTVSFFTT